MLSYFVANHTSFADLPSLGLAHICDKPNSLVCRQIIGGPFGFGYALGSTESIDERKIGYYQDRQEIRNFGKFAIARETALVFSPTSLRRSNAIQSHSWQDWADNTWDIPIARRWVDGSGNLAVQCALPRFLELNEDGNWIHGAVIPKHGKLWALANKFVDDSLLAMESATGDTYMIPMPSLDDVCDIVFGTNYRVSKFEIAFLKTLMESSCYEVMKLVKDDPGFEQLQKKTV